MLIQETQRQVWVMEFEFIHNSAHDQILSLLITEERCNYGHRRWLRHSSYLAVHKTENIIRTEIRKLDWSDKCTWRISRIITNTCYLVCLLQSKKINKFPILNFPRRFLSIAYFHAFWWIELDIWELPLHLCLADCYIFLWSIEGFKFSMEVDVLHCTSHRRQHITPVCCGVFSKVQEWGKT